MDILTDVLRTARLTAEVRGRQTRRPPWQERWPRADEGAFYFVARGHCRLTPEGGRARRLGPGDFAILLHGEAHELSDSGTGAKRTGPADVLAGRFRTDGGRGGPLACSLPPLVVLRGADHAPGSGLARLAAEAAGFAHGWEAGVARLAEVLLLEALRSHATGPAERADGGWLRGLADPIVAAAMRLMHERPEAPWTVAALADRAGVSRSAFAARFKAVTGDTPLGYLTWWRMQRAAARLREGGATVAEVARSVGYEAEAAFGKAFKRLFGYTPGSVRRSAHTVGSSPRTTLQAELKKRHPFGSPEQEAGLNVARTAAVLAAEFGGLFESHGLQPHGYNVLRILRGTGGPLPVAEVAARMVVDAPDLGTLLDRLVADELLERRFGAESSVAVTPAGLRLLAALDGPVLALHRRQLGHLSAAELEELSRLLVKARQGRPRPVPVDGPAPEA